MGLRATTITYAPATSTMAVRDTSIHRFRRPSGEKIQSDPVNSEYLRSLEAKFQWTITLKRLGELSSGWDSFGAPPPSRQSLSSVERLLDILARERLTPASIIASAEGGIGVCFKWRDRYADLEFLNSGEVVGVRYEGLGLPVVWETDSSEQALLESIKSIRDYFEA